MSEPIRMVVFDLGRVMIRICGSFEEAAAKAGVTHAPLTDSARRILHDASNAHGRGMLTDEMYHQIISDATGIMPEQAKQADDAILQGPYPGIFELVDELKQAGIKLACLSNTSNPHWQMMIQPRGEHPNALGLDGFDLPVASHLIQHMKPSQSVYRTFEQQAESMQISVEQFVFFDDLAPNIESAHARGWNAHQIADDGDSVSQLRRYLAKYDVLTKKVCSSP